jgi:signal transduction histidine kinase
MGITGADIVLEVLAGKDPGSIPLRANPRLGYSVNYKTMERFGLTERNLPAGTIVVDRPASLWELYRWYVVGAVSLIALQTLLIAGLVVQRRRRQAAEADIRAKERALRVSYDQVRKLNAQLISAQEDERARIARDLHDDVGQRLASLSIGLSALGRRTAASDQSAKTELANLQKSAVDLSKDLRDLSHELHPGILQHVDLPGALRARFEEVSAASDINLEVDVDSSWSEVSEELSLCLYRVAQEALRNVVKHSNANTVHIVLGHENGHAVMNIADDGQGFDESESNGFSGIGLLSMRERVRMLNGSLAVQSSTGGGTIATVRIPVGGKP